MVRRLWQLGTIAAVPNQPDTSGHADCIAIVVAIPVLLPNDHEDALAVDAAFTVSRLAGLGAGAVPVWHGRRYFGILNDNLPNQVHFINLHQDPGKPIDLTSLSQEQINAYGKGFRESSVAFMGSNTLADMKSLVDAAKDKEILFTGSIGKDKEIRLTAVKTDQAGYAVVNDVDKILDKQFTKEQKAAMFLIGHVHPQKLETIGTISIGGTNDPLYTYAKPSSPDYNSSGDYGPYLYRSASATSRGQSPALVLSRWGFAVYGTASSSTFGVRGNETVGKVTPGVESYYLYKSLKK